MPAADLTAFLESTLPDQLRAEQALHNGDLTLRLMTWSHAEPVTVFGADGRCSSGWDDVRAVFTSVAASFAGCDDYDYELLAAEVDGRLAYTVGIERYRAVTASGDTVDNELRVTHVYRREPGGWKIVHRHGDHLLHADGRRGSTPL